MSLTIRNTTPEDVPAVVALQPLAFPPPFSPALHWRPADVLAHVRVFPKGQFVVELDGEIVASSTNTIIGEANYLRHGDWMATVGSDPNGLNFTPSGTTLYGLDIAVHPKARRQGIGHAIYEARFALVRELGLDRYATVCRMPDYTAQAGGRDVHAYARAVVEGGLTDRTLTPLLRMGLTFIEVIEGYMPDPESSDAAALLRWRP